MSLFSFFKSKPKNQPYISIIGDTIHPEHGIELALNWTDDFVKYLKESGYSGTTDELVIQKYLVVLYSDMIERIREKTNNISDYE